MQENKQRKSTWMDTTQLVVSILIFIVFLGIAVFSFVGIKLSDRDLPLREFTPGIWAMGFGFLFLAGISLVSVISSREVYYGIDRPRQPNKAKKWLNWSIVLLPILILDGYFVFNAQNAPDFLLPLLTILALSVAMFWILKIGLRNYWGANLKRDSGLFSFSMSFGILYIMLVQILLLIFIVTMALVVVSDKIDLPLMMETLSTNPERFIETLSNNPTLVLIAFLMIAVFGPLIEELFKTIGVWFLKPRVISPCEGWIAGLMSGAGFGLIEAYLYSVQGLLMPSFSDWLYLVLGRIGGLLLHTFAGGIVGWGLARSWREKSPRHALVAYLVAFLLHSLWNTMAVAQGMLLSLHSIQLPDIVVYISLGVLFTGILLAYLSLSQKITRQAHNENSSETPYMSQSPTGISNWRA